MTTLSTVIVQSLDSSAINPNILNSSVSVLNSTNDSTLDYNLTVEEVLLRNLGPRQRSLSIVILLTIVYGLIFITGTVGNVLTCTVIVRNKHMQTSTNFYLFSLAVSDVMILIFGLPQEMYGIWEAYPWRLGEAFCLFRSLISEMTSCASVLTITAFSIERFIAIRHPLRLHKMTSSSRTIKINIAIWIVSLLCSLPFPIYTRVYYTVPFHNSTAGPIVDSLVCGIPPKWKMNMIYMFQVSTFLFFVTPISIITVLYILMGLSLRASTMSRTKTPDVLPRVSHGHSYNRHVHPARKSILKILVAVVVAFVICWAPYHAQRLMVLYVTVWSRAMLDIYSILFYISGVLYYVSSTVNPILYNVMSRRYRMAFIDTVCCCKSKPLTYLTRASTYQQSADVSYKAPVSPHAAPSSPMDKTSVKGHAFLYRTPSPQHSNTSPFFKPTHNGFQSRHGYQEMRRLDNGGYHDQQDNGARVGDTCVK